MMIVCDRCKSMLNPACLEDISYWITLVAPTKTLLATKRKHLCTDCANKLSKKLEKTFNDYIQEQS